jgi:hypothetical protein
MSPETADVVMQRAQIRLRELLNDRPMAVLIDPTLADPLSESTEYRDAFDVGTAKKWLLRNLHADIDPERAPYLIHLPSEAQAERLITASLRLSIDEAFGQLGADYKGRSVCAWIGQVSDAERLARRLAHAARVIKPDGSPWPLRFWDPRVIWHLPRVLSSDAWGALQAALGGWYTLSPANRLECFGPTDTTAVESIPSAWPAPNRFNAATWGALERIGSVNKVLGVARDWGVLPTEAEATRIDQLLQRCAAWGFDSEQDALAFTACGLTSHEHFDQHPQVWAVLEEACRDRRSFASAIDEFDEPFWQSLSNGQWLSSTFSAQTGRAS